MKLTTGKARISISAALTFTLVAARITSVSAATAGIVKGAKFVPNAYIVEFDNEAAAKVPEVKLQAKLTTFLSTLHADFDNHLRARGVAFTMRQEFHEPEIFSGVSVRLADPKLLSELQNAPNVKSVYRTRFVSNPNKEVKVKVANATTATATDAFSTHVMTGVDQVHAKKYFGKGVKIAILDTGVDYKHPALGKCFGKGCRISFGYDLTGDDYDGTTTPIPDPDPYSSCGTHGTHVTGIIAANDTKLGFTGVAPRAEIGMYRVFGCHGASSDDVLVAGLTRAYKEGADVISMSLGEATGWSESPLSVVASRIAQKGKVVVVSQGNDAASGMFYSSTPASGFGVISVASVDNTKYTTYTAKTSINRDITYYTAHPFTQKTALPITYQGDGCSGFTSDDDFSGQVVLVSRGNCPLQTKAINARMAGAKIVLIYNTDAAPLILETSEIDILAAVIPKADGLALVAAVQKATAKKPVTITFPQMKFQTEDNTQTGGKISYFSTYGPTYNLDQANPLIAGPGGNILSTWPVRLGSYAIISGTSMSAPFIAGAAAVYLSAKGKTYAQAKALNAVFATTANPIVESATSSTLNTVVVQGGGLLNLSHAFTAQSTVIPPMLFLNDTAYFKGQQTIKIRNNAKNSVTYTFGHSAAGTAIALDGEGGYNPYPVPLVKNAAGVKFSLSKATVAPGKTATLIVTFTAPKGLDAKKQPVYSGFITIKSSNEKEQYQVPYFGLAARVIDQQILERANEYPKLVDAFNNPYTTTKTWTFKDADSPTVVTYLFSGSAYVSVDVVPAAASGIPANPKLRARSFGSVPDDEASFEYEERDTQVELDERSGYGAIPMMDDGLMPRGIVGSGSGGISVGVKAQVPTDLLSALSTKKPFVTLGQITGGSRSYAARSVDDDTLYNFAWDGTVEVGTNGNRTLPNGSYRLFLSALKISGDPSKASDYDTWLSPIINIKRS